MMHDIFPPTHRAAEAIRREFWQSQFLLALSATAVIRENGSVCIFVGGGDLTLWSNTILSETASNSETSEDKQIILSP